MRISRELKLMYEGEEKRIYFAEATTDTELLEIYKLRYSVYLKKGYIDPSKYLNEAEKDAYDDKRSTRHFFVRFEGKTIGCARIIIDDPLPTEKYFGFTEPSLIARVKRENRFEIGRLIIVRPNETGEYLPRGLVMLFLYETVCEYARQNNLIGGYAFIKKSLEKKMLKLRIPIHLITPYRQRYPNDGVLYKYFSQSEDPVTPICFLTESFLQYSQKIIHNRWLFRKVSENVYSLRSTLYTLFLKKLKII